jgi:hypothetical protein
MAEARPCAWRKVRRGKRKVRRLADTARSAQHDAATSRPEEGSREEVEEGKREMTTFRTPYEAEKQERKLQQWHWD